MNYYNNTIFEQIDNDSITKTDKATHIFLSHPTLAEQKEIVATKKMYYSKNFNVIDKLREIILNDFGGDYIKNNDLEHRFDSLKYNIIVNNLVGLILIGNYSNNINDNKQFINYIVDNNGNKRELTVTSICETLINDYILSLDKYLNTNI